MHSGGLTLTLRVLASNRTCRRRFEKRQSWWSTPRIRFQPAQRLFGVVALRAGSHVGAVLFTRCSGAPEGSAQREGRGVCGRDRRSGHLCSSRFSSASPPEDVGEVRSYGHRSGRRDACSPRVAGRVSADRRRRAADDQPQDLAAHFADITRSQPGSEHRSMHSGMRQRPGLAQHVSVLEVLPAAVPVAVASALLGFDQERIDPCPDLIRHPSHQINPFAKARQRRWRMR